MADTKISALVDGGTIQAGDEIPVNRAGSNKKVTVSAGSIGYQLIGVGTTAAALDIIGGTAIGKGVFTAATTAAAQTLLEAGTVGLQVFKTATTAAAQNALGGTVVGKAIFEAASTAAAANYLDVLRSDTAGQITGADAIKNAVSLTSAEFAAGSAVATTLYFITDAT